MHACDQHKSYGNVLQPYHSETFLLLYRVLLSSNFISGYQVEGEKIETVSHIKNPYILIRVFSVSMNL